MTLKDARALRDEITKGDGLHSVVPLGRGPDGYFARIWGAKGQTDFHSRREWLAYRKGVRARRAAVLKDAEYFRDHGFTLPKPRSPLDLMIDRACGLA